MKLINVWVGDVETLRDFKQETDNRFLVELNAHSWASMGYYFSCSLYTYIYGCEARGEDIGRKKEKLSLSHGYLFLIPSNLFQVRGI